jgi:glycosyltransferase involved in cell wall biosynthesis
VIARNAAQTLPTLLRALAGQTIGPNLLETFVVDDGSSDATAQIAKEAGIATVLTTTGALGDAARNLAIRRARAEVIAITDADCEPASDWLERAIDDLDALGVDLIAGHIEVPLSERPSVAELLDFCRFLDQERAVREIRCGATANLVLRRSVFEHVGLFNERLVAGGDVEFGMRARAAGCQVAYSPRAIVVHPPRATARGLIGRCFRGGVATAHMVRYGSGPAREQPVVWRRLGAYRPSRRIYGIERLHAHGIRPTGGQLWRLTVGQWAFVQLPIVAGNMVGFLRDRRDDNPGPSTPSPSSSW